MDNFAQFGSPRQPNFTLFVCLKKQSFTLFWCPRQKHIRIHCTGCWGARNGVKFDCRANGVSFNLRFLKGEFFVFYKKKFEYIFKTTYVLPLYGKKFKTAPPPLKKHKCWTLKYFMWYKIFSQNVLQICVLLIVNTF